VQASRQEWGGELTYKLAQEVAITLDKVVGNNDGIEQAALALALA
jgi:hypothetical protein